MAENKTSAKGKDQQKTAEEDRSTPEGQVTQSSSAEGLGAQQDPQIDPTMQPREQVPAMVDPERPYVDGQDDPYREMREPGTTQIPAKVAEEAKRTGK